MCLHLHLAGVGDRADALAHAATLRGEPVDRQRHEPAVEVKGATYTALEVKQADDCHRRAVQAQKIGDEETVEVALRFEAKHRVAVDVWVQKIEAAEAELGMQLQTVEEQTEQLKEARARKDVIAIQARRAGSTERMRGGGRSSADEFDRLADAIEREGDLSEASRAVDNDLDGGYDPHDFGDEGPSLSKEELAELQLRELKRRMKEDA